MGAVLNFRDLGGYATTTGGTTRWGLVFRSDSLSKLTTAETSLFEGIGIRAVYDLRSAEERELKPSRAGSRHVPVTSRSPTAAEVSALRTRDDGEQWLCEEYHRMLLYAAADFGSLFSFLAEPEDRPAVFHCAGGKDRAGLAAALLLSWLGVDRETVLDDYELTSVVVRRDDLAEVVNLFCQAGMSPAAAMGVLSTPRWAMATALDELDTVYGGVEAYLRDRAGMGSDHLDALREQLVAA
jgi:protein-tyrosine phosphatase